ncbi:MAG: tRNA glutamyl-Q(34) synthetase GluQRS [Gallionella sp.]|jgi:glutamyl-Q tRNA(Asp) synthetase
MSSRTDYRGRFAPSPTGPLHFGSLVAALASYLDAKHHNGTWLVRIEDLDTPRCVPGATKDILNTLDALGLHSDEPILYQSLRTDAYQAAFERLAEHLYPCACTRREIADSAMIRGDELIYPGTCRGGLPPSREPRSWRVRVDQHFIEFTDRILGTVKQDMRQEAGDFIVKRADGLYAYQLAVVVDDEAQGVNAIVRGADLLNSTPRQIYLQHLLGFPTPSHMHIPVAVNANGEKLSKQTRAAAVQTDNPTATLYNALQFLRQKPPASLRTSTVRQLLDWATENWRPSSLKIKQYNQ